MLYNVAYKRAECRDGDFYLTVGLFENVEEICAVYDSEQKGN